nr:hypothetical protein [Kribbella catacumbae]
MTRRRPASSATVIRSGSSELAAATSTRSSATNGSQVSSPDDWGCRGVIARSTSVPSTRFPTSSLLPICTEIVISG